MNTDILLIAPPFSYGALDKASPRVPPLGIATIAAVLEHEGYSVAILDAFALNLSENQILENITTIQPHIIGITSVAANMTLAHHILHEAKKINPTIITLYGGSQATIQPRETCAHSFIDYGVIGEADQTMKELIAYCLKGIGTLEHINGIGYWKTKENWTLTSPRAFIPDINTLPIPAYHLLPMNIYKPYAVLDTNRTFSTMITSRGCLYRCTFCSSAAMLNHTWRPRSAKNILAEMRILHEQYGINHIYFEDDEFCINKKRVEDFCQLLIDSKMDIIWECLTRVNSVTSALLKKMKKAGCQTILYGIECGYEEGLKKIRKGITLQQAKETIHATQKAGIMARAAFIIGFSWETEIEIKQTIAFAKKLDADITYFSTLTPYTNTPVYQETTNNDLFTERYSPDNHIQHGTVGMIKTKTLTPQQLAYWNGRAYLTFYLRPSYLWKKIRHVKNVQHFWRSANAGFDLLKLAFNRIRIS